MRRQKTEKEQKLWKETVIRVAKISGKQKKITNKNDTKQKQAGYPKFFYKVCLVVTDKEKNKMFKQLLIDTLKNQEAESSINSELCGNIENETKAIINTHEDIEQLGIVVTRKEIDETLKESRKTCAGPGKISTNSLKNYAEILKPLPVSSYLTS